SPLPRAPMASPPALSSPARPGPASAFPAPPSASHPTNPSPAAKWPPSSYAPSTFPPPKPPSPTPKATPSPPTSPPSPDPASPAAAAPTASAPTNPSPADKWPPSWYGLSASTADGQAMYASGPAETQPASSALTATSTRVDGSAKAPKLGNERPNRMRRIVRDARNTPMGRHRLERRYLHGQHDHRPADRRPWRPAVRGDPGASEPQRMGQGDGPRRRGAGLGGPTRVGDRRASVLPILDDRRSHET